MPKATKQQKKSEAEHTLLTVCVEHYDSSLEACVNHNVYDPQYAWDLDDDDPLYQFKMHLTITGTSSYPDARAGEKHELTIYAGDGASRRLGAKLKDIQAHEGDYNAPKYRKYHGRQIPVYNPPNGIGQLNKVRGRPLWTAWIEVAPKFVTDSLVLLGQHKKHYLAIHERKVGRTRWIQSLSLQTNDPADE